MSRRIALRGLAMASLAISLGVLAPAFAQKGDMEQSPGLNGWTLVNACGEPVWTAILADGRVWGWIKLNPGESTPFAHRDATIGVHALIGGQGTWWAPAGHGSAQIPVDLNNSFDYRLGTATPGNRATRTFILYDILARGGRVAICEQ